MRRGQSTCKKCERAEGLKARNGQGRQAEHPRQFGERKSGEESAECDRYEKKLQKQATEASLLGLGIGLFQGSSNVCINAAVLLVLHQGGTAVLAGELSSGNLTTFLVSTQQIQRALAQLSVLFGSAVKANAAG